MLTETQYVTGNILLELCCMNGINRLHLWKYIKRNTLHL